MKRTLKERITALGLSYQRELMVIVMIVLFTIGGALALILIMKQTLIGVLVFGAGVLGLYFYISRYSSLEKKQQKEHVDNLISLISYFEIFISNGHNVYTSFKMLLEYSDPFLNDAIASMLNQIDTDKTVGPYIAFAAKFNDRIVESLMLSIYQMVDNGEESINLNEFDILFNGIKQKYQEDLIENKRRSLDTLNSFPLIAAGAVTLVLSLSIISVIGDYINVI